MKTKEDLIFSGEVFFAVGDKEPVVWEYTGWEWRWLERIGGWLEGFDPINGEVPVVTLVGIRKEFPELEK